MINDPQHTRSPRFSKTASIAASARASLSRLTLKDAIRSMRFPPVLLGGWNSITHFQLSRQGKVPINNCSSRVKMAQQTANQRRIAERREADDSFADRNHFPGANHQRYGHAHPKLVLAPEDGGNL